MFSKPKLVPTDKTHLLAARLLDHVALYHSSLPQRLTLSGSLQLVPVLPHVMDWGCTDLLHDAQDLQRSPVEFLPDDDLLREHFLVETIVQLWQSAAGPLPGPFKLELSENSVKHRDWTIEVPPEKRLFDKSFLEWIETNSAALQVYPVSGGANMDVAIGSYSPQEKTWCWAWANGSIQPAQSAAVAALRQTHPLRCFRIGGFKCTPPFARLVATIASQALGQPVCEQQNKNGLLAYFAGREG